MKRGVPLPSFWGWTRRWVRLLSCGGGDEKLVLDQCVGLFPLPYGRVPNSPRHASALMVGWHCPGPRTTRSWKAARSDRSTRDSTCSRARQGGFQGRPPEGRRSWEAPLRTSPAAGLALWFRTRAQHPAWRPRPAGSPATSAAYLKKAKLREPGFKVLSSSGEGVRSRCRRDCTRLASHC